MRKVCWCKQPTSDCMHLIKLYDTSAIILLGNVLVHICSEICKIWLTLWMVYTCSVKGWRKLKSWVEMNVLCIVDKDHQWWVIAVDHTSKFKVIWLILTPSLMLYNTENGASLQKLTDKSQISGKR